MSDTLTVQVRHASENLLEAAFNLAGGHAALLYRRVKISSGTEFHDFTPMLLLVLNEINRLDNIDVVQCGRYAKLCSQLLDVFFF